MKTVAIESAPNDFCFYESAKYPECEIQGFYEQRRKWFSTIRDKPLQQQRASCPLECTIRQTVMKTVAIESAPNDFCFYESAKYPECEIQGFYKQRRELF